MKYFSTLPTISITTQDNISRVYKNLMARVSVIPSVLTNPINFYTYDIQDGDTPEIIAEKYYGDPYRYWIVLFCNELLDGQWDWPVSSNILSDYVDNKYAGTGIDAYNDVKAYRKTITQTNVVSNTTTVNTVEISEDDYNSSQDYTKTISTITGDVIVSVQKNIQNYYDYEVEKNEAKRSIKLLNKIYVTQLENEFKNLLK